MKQLFFLLAIIATLIISSCQKDNHLIERTSVVWDYNHIIEVPDNDTITYRYAFFQINNGDVKPEFFYKGDSVLVKQNNDTLYSFGATIVTTPDYALTIEVETPIQFISQNGQIELLF